jgi:hypothetical protein
MVNEYAIGQTIQRPPENHLRRRVGRFMTDLVVYRPVQHKAALLLPGEPCQKCFLPRRGQAFSSFPMHRLKQAIYPMDM